MADDWLAQVQARFDYAEASDTDVGDLTAWYMQDTPRLLACAEALRELVTMNDGVPELEDWGSAWERARRALAGEGGE